MALEDLAQDIFEDREQAFGLTIDGPSSLDLDDAIWLDRKDGDYVVHVSIADVGALVEIGSEVDQKALKQGFTQYLSTSNKPMLPRKLSENEISLLEGQKRPTLTVSVPITQELEIGKPTIKQSVLTSTRKLSYAQAEKMRDTSDDPFLGEAFRLSKGLFEKRRTKGAIVFFDKGRGISTTEDGNIVRLKPVQRYNSHLLIQEFMILANQAVAEYFAQENIPGLFRNHHARNAAPQDRTEILRDLEETLTEGDAGRMNTLRQRLGLILERASYGPSLTGHYGLNLPAYMHFTSPIRRFPDLVNHRQLVASLKGEKLPYDADALSSMANSINDIENMMKDERNIDFKEQDLRASRRVLTGDHLGTLDSIHFYKAIRVAAKESALNPELEKHIYDRLDRGRLIARDLFSILLESDPEDQDMERVRKKSIDWLQDNPHEAYSILKTAEEILGWSEPEYTVKIRGPDHGKIFTVQGALVVEGVRHLSGEQASSSKKKSEQYAAVELIKSFLGMEQTQRDQASEHIQTSHDKPAENYKGSLLARCEKERWPAPTYTSSNTGEDHSREFRVIAKLPLGETVYTSRPGIAGTKKAAEQLASKSLLEQLPEERLRRAAPKKIQDADPKYISKLSGVLGGIHPEYTYREEGEGYICDCVAPLPDNSSKKYSAPGPSKKVSKRNAAKVAYEHLNPLYQKNN